MIRKRKKQQYLGFLRQEDPIVFVGIIIIILVIYLMNTLVKSFEIWHIDTTCHNYGPNTDWPTSDNRGRHRPRPNVHFLE